METLRAHEDDDSARFRAMEVDVEITRRWLLLREAGAPSGPDRAQHAPLNEECRSWRERRLALRLEE